MQDEYLKQYRKKHEKSDIYEGFSVWRVCISAIQSPFKNINIYSKIAFFPFMICMISTFSTIEFGYQEQSFLFLLLSALGCSPVLLEPLCSLFISLLNMYTVSLFSVNLVRFFINGEGRKKWIELSWDWRPVIMCVFSISFIIFMSLFFIPFLFLIIMTFKQWNIFLSGCLGLLGVTSVLYVCARTFFVPYLIAMGVKSPIRKSFKLSQHYFCKLMVLFFLVLSFCSVALSISALGFWVVLALVSELSFVDYEMPFFFIFAFFLNFLEWIVFSIAITAGLRAYQVAIIEDKNLALCSLDGYKAL